MTDLLRDRANFLESQRDSHCTSPVDYIRLSDGSTKTVNATMGKTGFEITDESGFKIGGTIVDFLILSEALGFEPSSGDIIVDSGRKYEVVPFGNDGPWRWSEPGLTYRIHTSDIGAF